MKIKINGQEIEVENESVLIEIESHQGNLEIQHTGTLNDFSTNTSVTIGRVQGNAKVGGSCNVETNVGGNVESNGSCKIGKDVGGSVNANGSCNIQGDVCNGNVNAGGSVKCVFVTGDIEAGGSVKINK